MTTIYAWFSGVFLMLQGMSTLAARLLPALDDMFPALLERTRMVPAHSLLHIVTALAAFAVIRLGSERSTFRFALWFGMFYLGLGLAGISTGQSFCMGLQPFDHPFHVVLGGLGITAAAFQLARGHADAFRKRATANKGGGR